LAIADIGANLTDAMFKGIYHGKTCHPGDLSSVLKRSFNSGLEKLIITGGDLKESEKALSLCYLDERLYCTVGCHPTRCLEFETFPSSHSSESYYHNLLALAKLGIQQGKVVACGECGLGFYSFCLILVINTVQHKIIRIVCDSALNKFK
jgi:TatD DNase family protein